MIKIYEAREFGTMTENQSSTKSNEGSPDKSNKIPEFHDRIMKELEYNLC